MRQWLWSEPQDGRCFPFQERNIGEVLSGGRTFSRLSFWNTSLNKSQFSSFSEKYARLDTRGGHGGAEVGGDDQDGCQSV